MHFITFPVASTNIFPLSNSTQGGQLVTEFNLKSRDMVATNPNVKYPIGPSFLHSEDDFKVTLLTDTDISEYDPHTMYYRGDYCRYNNVIYVCIKDIAQLDDPDTIPGIADSQYWVPGSASISSSILQIAPGRGVINGHYVETLAPMRIDLNLANAELRATSQEELYGNLSIGIKTYFSTENTMTGAMLIENADNMYVGVQLVITQREKFTLPEDCPDATQEGTAVADIKLADFTYLNGVVSEPSIKQNPNKMRYIPSERIRDFSSLLDDKYVSTDNLVDKYIYTYGGNHQWCNSVGSLMQWDLDAGNLIESWIPADVEIPVTRRAEFVTDTYGNVHLVVPHKQPDGDILNPANPTEKLFYKDRDIQFPTANYARGTSGVVTKEYTDIIKDVQAKLSTYKKWTTGKQIAYWETLTMDSDGKYSHEFPQSLTEYEVGDYILVREDYTASATEDEGVVPSTMYVVLPGSISGLVYVADKPKGLRLATEEVAWEGDGNIDLEDILPYIANFYQEMKPYSVDDIVAYDDGMWKCTASTTGAWDAECWVKVYNSNALTILNYISFRGNISADYFEIDYHNSDDTQIIPYYYVVAGNNPKTWSNPLLLTGGTALATEDQVGGFYNASTDAAYADAGYVYLDDTGHLRLRDYELLRTGALAYQLGADFTVPSNQTPDQIQAYLDESVNARVAFMTNISNPVGMEENKISVPPMIDVYIPLPADETGVISLYNLDSRFGTGVYVHFMFEDKSRDYSGLVINISDCEKIRIDSSITTLESGSPLLNIFRSCLYYDASVINYIRSCDPGNARRNVLFPAYPGFTGCDNLTLWYARFSENDPMLTVNGMEVSQPNTEKQVGEISFWDENISGDNHYTYALRSITLSHTGNIIGCSLYVSNGSTQTDAPIDGTTKRIILASNFVLPAGPSLNYPVASLVQPLKITGTFTTAYQPTDNSAIWVVTDTTFTATTGTWSAGTRPDDGMISFSSAINVVDAIYTHGSLLGMQPGSYHIFYGGAVVSDDT